jgi:hypothetical protein
MGNAVDALGEKFLADKDVHPAKNMAEKIGLGALAVTGYYMSGNRLSHQFNLSPNLSLSLSLQGQGNFLKGKNDFGLKSFSCNLNLKF